MKYFCPPDIRSWRSGSYPRLEKILDPSSQNMDLDKKKQWSQDNENEK